VADHDGVDVRLERRGSVPPLSHVHAHGAATSEGKDLGTHQGIEEDDVAVLEDLMAPASQETGIAGTGPHEVDRSPGDVGFVHDRAAEQEPCRLMPPHVAFVRIGLKSPEPKAS